MTTLEQRTSSLWEKATEWTLRGRGQRYRHRGNAPSVLGGYYEHLAARILGGRVLYDPQCNDAHKPDIYDAETETWRECKAKVVGGHYNLVIDQTEAYFRLAEEQHVEYVLFRHRMKGTKQERSKEAIFKDAAASPKIAVVIPASIVSAAIQTGHPVSHIYPNFGEGVYTLTASFVDGLIDNFEVEIPKIGLDCSSFSFQAFRTPHMNVLGYGVKPFIFTRITEKE